MIHDSDVLWFSIYKKGKEIFILDNTDEYLVVLRNVCWHKEAPEVYVKEDGGEYLPMPAEFL